MRDLTRLIRWYWRHGFSWRKVAAAMLSGYGALWLIVEVVSFFSATAGEEIKHIWWLFVLAGLVWAVWESWPKLAVSCHLAERDILLEVRVGDLFAGDTSIVIGCNTSFDTEIQTNLINPNSVQGQYTARYFDAPAHLDLALGTALASVASSGNDQQKRGKQTLYPIGTTTKVRSRNRTAYLCAIARMNQNGNAVSSFEEIQRALPQLWEYIATAGDHGKIAVPVLGSGFSRVPKPREELIREIIKSFVAACSSQSPCEALSVVIHPKDFYANNVDLGELGRFLAHVCKYTDFARANARGVGEAIVDSPAATQPLVDSADHQ